MKTLIALALTAVPFCTTKAQAEEKPANPPLAACIATAQMKLDKDIEEFIHLEKVFEITPEEKAEYSQNSLDTFHAEKAACRKEFGKK